MKKSILFNALVLSAFLFGCDDDQEKDNTPTIDLKAESIEFTVDKTSEFEGTAFIRGTVKNVGANFVSDPGQQVVRLHEKPLGGESKVVAEQEFSRLNAGEEIELKYSRPWNSSSPSEGEFPPDYIISISYGPDILVDGTESNDDQNTENNKLQESGTAINDLFRN